MGLSDAAMSGGETDRLPEATPDVVVFRPCVPRDHWVAIAMNDIADHVRTKHSLRVDWQRWTVIPEDDALAMVYPPGLYFEGWAVAPHSMVPQHREPAGISVPREAYV